MRRFVCCSALLLGLTGPAVAQMPDTCKLPASMDRPPNGTPQAKIYDAEGAWFAGRGNLSCAAAAFSQALRLDPKSAEAHFDLGLVRQREHDPAAALREFRMALEDDPALLQAHCAVASALVDPTEAETELRKALESDPNLVCAMDGLAQILLKGGRYDAALAYWRRATQIQPNAEDLQLSLAVATYRVAKARKDDGRPEIEGLKVADAVQLFTKLLQDHPNLTQAHFLLGNIYSNEHRYREAADEYREVTRENPGNVDALRREVDALLNVGAYSDALLPAKSLALRRPNDASAHVMLGMVYRGMGDYAKAEPELALGAARDPNDFEAQYQLGFVLARLGKLQLALPRLRKAVELNPHERSAQYQLETVLRALGQKEEADKIAAQVQRAAGNEFQKSQVTSEGIKANDLLQAGRAAEAAQIYRTMLDEDPNSAWTAYNLGLALEATNDLSGAESALRKGIDIDPKLGKIRAELGQLELTEGDIESAERWLQSALDLDPQLAEARVNLAVLRAKQGDLTSAVKLLRQAVEDDPNSKDGHLELGVILARQGWRSEAEEELSKAVALAPQDPVTLSTAGKATVELGKMTEGITLLEKVVDLAPDLAATHLDLGIALADSYDLPRALAQMSEAVRLAPQSGVAHFNRGRVLFDMGRNADAQPEFETACRLVPRMAEPRYFLALIHKQAGDLAVATSLLRDTVQLTPGNLTALYLLGQCLEQQHQTDEAIAVWRHTIAIDPKFSQALFGLARALRSTDPAESEQLMRRYAAVQKERQLLDEVDTLANDGVVAASAHQWPEAIRQLKEAIAECRDCATKADLHKKLGMIDCQSGDLENGRKELLVANALKPADPDVLSALQLVARARSQHSKAQSGKTN